MSKSIKQLRNDLTTLSAEVHNLANQLKEAYDQYLTNFVEAVGRQLIVASYQICTQRYPESFLSLSYNTRVKLQENLKNIGNLFKAQLGKAISEIEIDNQELNKSFQIIFIKLGNQEIEAQIDTDIQQEDSTEIDNSHNEFEFLNPEELLQLHLDLENCLEDSLNELSRLGNNYLQQAAILPRQIPAKILEMALQSEESSAITNSPPNLLNLLIEKENPASKDDKNIMPITAICLRVSEIEFAETSLNNYRNKIRNIMSKVEQITEIFLRKKREYAIAEAESAWRASWYEENK